MSSCATCSTHFISHFKTAKLGAFLTFLFSFIMTFALQIFLLSLKLKVENAIKEAGTSFALFAGLSLQDANQMNCAFE